MALAWMAVGAWVYWFLVRPLLPMLGEPDPPGEWCNCGFCQLRRKREGKREYLRNGVYPTWWGKW